MVEGPSESVGKIQFVRSAARLPGPPREAVVRVSLRHRLRVMLDSFLWLRSANTIREILFTEIAFAFGAFSAGVATVAAAGGWRGAVNSPVDMAIALVAGAIGLLSVLFPNFTGFLIGLILVVVSMAVRDVAAGAALLEGDYWRLAHVYAVAFGVAALVRFTSGQMWGRFRQRTGHKDDKREGSETLALSFKHADKVADRVRTILTDCFDTQLLEKITSIKTDRAAPYRLIRGVLPVNPLFFRRPRHYLSPPLSRGTERYRHYRLIVDTTDAICAGLLGLVGARPRLRYGEDSDKPLANDRYWRSDGQELNDTGSSDVFLRFHQSTVEADFPPKNKAGDVCNFKAYAVMNNFRGTPLYLLRVRDVIDVLYCRHLDYSAQQQQSVYDGLNINSGEQVITFLKISRYAKFTARADRYQHETTEKLGKSVIAFTDEAETDAIMSFDPGRVWAMKEAPIEMFDAIMALRRAIHLASRKCAIEVTPERRDVLLVDNLRMLICRREDAPNSFLRPLSLFRDTFAGTFAPLSGRWLRQIYGFPEKVRAASADPEASLTEESRPASGDDDQASDARDTAPEPTE